MALVLTGVAVLCGGVVVDAVMHPARYAAVEKAGMAEEPVAAAAPVELIENGIDLASGFIAEGEYQLVKTTCTGCHSGKLVLQNRADREGWLAMIRWMQQTQNLWDLGADEDKILDYLATYYPPEDVGRRANLAIEEGDWYWIGE